MSGTCTLVNCVMFRMLLSLDITWNPCAWWKSCPSSAELKMLHGRNGPYPAPIRRHHQPEGIRFEIPSRYHHFQRLGVRAAFWDLSQVHEPLAFADTLRARRGQPAPAHEHGQ